MFPVDPATEGGTFFESKYENSQKVATSTPEIIQAGQGINAA